jgi:uncharacterized protein YicC (UPF0701 family)
MSESVDRPAMVSDVVAATSELRQAMQSDIGSAKSELREEIAAAKSELREEIAAATSELREEIATAKSELKADFRAAITREGRRTRRHFNVMVEKVEAAVKIVAEVNSHHATVLDDHEARLKTIENRS